jgi:hypothetical protein
MIHTHNTTVLFQVHVQQCTHLQYLRILLLTYTKRTFRHSTTSENQFQYGIDAPDLLKPVNF